MWAAIRAALGVGLILHLDFLSSSFSLFAVLFIHTPVVRFSLVIPSLHPVSDNAIRSAGSQCGDGAPAPTPPRAASLETLLLNGGSRTEALERRL